MRFLQSRAEVYRDAVARLWAAATAYRDGDAEVAELAEARPVIDAVLARSERAFLLLALDDSSDRIEGFAAVEPFGETTASLEYLGVLPDRWGSGIARAVLEQLPVEALTAGFASATLLVYVDNARAVALYQGLGWHPSGEPVPHPRTGRPEQRYVLDSLYVAAPRAEALRARKLLLRFDIDCGELVPGHHFVARGLGKIGPVMGSDTATETVPGFDFQYELVPGVPNDPERGVWEYLVGIDYSADVELPWEPNDGGAIAPFKGGATTHGARGGWPLPARARRLSFYLKGTRGEGELTVDLVDGTARWQSLTG